MSIGVNSYYSWLKLKDICHQKEATRHLKARIKVLFNENRQVYGSVRIQKALEKEVLFYCRSYIGVLMKQMGLKSVLSKKFKVMTTDSNHQYPIAENLLNRDFTSLKIGQKWVSDITYIKVGYKWNYVTTIIDLADRKIVSWTLSQDMTTENTVYKAWLKARGNRQVTSDHIFHSDRGVQYASNKMTSLLRQSNKIKQSMSRKGNCWDNAVAESFFKTLKYECTNRYRFKTIFQAHKIITDYIHWYNYKRMHSTLDYKTPAEKEMEIRKNNYKNVA